MLKGATFIAGDKHLNVQETTDHRSLKISIGAEYLILSGNECEKLMEVLGGMRSYSSHDRLTYYTDEEWETRQRVKNEMEVKRNEDNQQEESTSFDSEGDTERPL